MKSNMRHESKMEAIIDSLIFIFVITNSGVGKDAKEISSALVEKLMNSRFHIPMTSHTYGIHHA